MTGPQQKVLSLLEQGRSVTIACQRSGIKRKEFYEWLKDDSEFREAIGHADVADIITIEDVLFVKALSGSVADRKLYLERREGGIDHQKSVRNKDIADLQKQLGLK